MSERHDLSTLFEGATPRPRVADAERDAVFAAVRDRWQKNIDARRRRRRTWLASGIGVAAALVVAVTPLVRGPAPPPQAIVAHLQFVSGEVLIRPADDTGWRRLDSATQTIAKGTRLRTLDGQLRLRTARGGSLRVNQATLVAFGPADYVTLPEGELYFDSGARHASIHVETPLGTISNRGTQFLVSSGPEALSVAVRSGKTVLAGPQGRYQTTSAGERRVLRRGDDESRLTVIDQKDALWDWADSLEPQFPMDGRSALEYLEWVCDETGHTLSFASAAARARAAEKVYRGSGTAGVSISTVDIALRSVGLTASLRNNELLVSILD